VLTKNISRILLGAVVLVIFLGGVAWADALYEEHFDGGAGIANYPDWELGNNDEPFPTQIIGEKVGDVVDPGSGDHALLTGMHNAFDTWGSQVRVQNTTPFERGNNARVTLKVWGGPEAWGLATFSSGAGLLGPWHGFIDYPDRKVNDDIEAGINWFGNTHGGARWEENGLLDDNGDANLCNGCGTLSGPRVHQAYVDAFKTSGPTKANCLWIRCWLGDNAGGFLEWSSDGMTWTGLTSAPGNFGGANDGMQQADVLLDSRDPTVPPGGAAYVPPMNDWDNDGDGDTHVQTPSMVTPLYLAFGVGQNGAGSVYIDDLVVEDDMNTVSPPVNRLADWVWVLY